MQASRPDLGNLQEGLCQQTLAGAGLVALQVGLRAQAL